MGRIDRLARGLVCIGLRGRIRYGVGGPSTEDGRVRDWVCAWKGVRGKRVVSVCADSLREECLSGKGFSTGASDLEGRWRDCRGASFRCLFP